MFQKIIFIFNLRLLAHILAQKCRAENHYFPSRFCTIMVAIVNVVGNYNNYNQLLKIHCFLLQLYVKRLSKHFYLHSSKYYLVPAQTLLHPMICENSAIHDELNQASPPLLITVCHTKKIFYKYSANTRRVYTETDRPLLQLSLS